MKITKSQLKRIIREEYQRVLAESMGQLPAEILDNYELRDFEAWIEDGNAMEVESGVWVEQSTQYRKKFTLEELKLFFKLEYLQ